MVFEGVFTGASSSLFSETQSSSNNNNPYQREINLASNFERTLGLQAVGLLAALVFVVYVGVTGGITDGLPQIFYVAMPLACKRIADAPPRRNPY